MTKEQYLPDPPGASIFPAPRNEPPAALAPKKQDWILTKEKQKLTNRLYQVVEEFSFTSALKKYDNIVSLKIF